MEAEHRWRAMGCDAHVIVVDGPAGLLERAVERIAELESRWSRFDPTSELSRLNAGAGQFMEVSEDTRLLLGRCLEGADLSGGAFDATLLPALVAAGYDRTFEELGPDIVPTAPPPLALGASDGPVVEFAGGLARLCPGASIDSGGIGKGLAADLVVGELLDGGAAGACVNLGGDLRVAGWSPSGDGWTIALDHEWCEDPFALVGVAEGAIATSTTLRRRWRAGDGWNHHLIDPRSRLPSDTDLNHVTVIASEAWIAEVLAKSVLLNGSEYAFGILGGTGAEALSVDEVGRVSSTDGFHAYLGGAELPPVLVAPREPVVPV